MSQSRQAGRSRGKGAEEYMRAYLQTQVRAWIAAEPGRKAKDLAALAGLTEGQISQVQNHGRAVGMKTVEGLAQAFGITYDELKRRALAAWEDRPPALRVVREGDQLANCDMTGWDEAEVAARKQMDGMPNWTFDIARRRTGLVPRAGVTVQYVIDEAVEVFRYATPAQVIERTNMELDRKVEELRKPKRKKT